MKIERSNDYGAMADIWLEASLEAHPFIDGEYWRSNYGAMRDRYLPAAENYALTDGGVMRGFVSLSEGGEGQHIEALFVAPEWQGRGAGRTLLDHAGSLSEVLTLAVYEENARALRFYLRNGFLILERSTDAATGHPELLMIRRSENNPVR